MTEQDKFEKENAEIFKMFEETEKEHEEIASQKNGLKALKAEVLSRLSAKKRRSQILEFLNFNNETLIVRDGNKNIIAHMSLSGKLKEKITSKIELNPNYEPIFILRRSNEEYLKYNLTHKKMMSINRGVTPKELTIACRENEPTLSIATQIYTLIANKDYDAVDAYINDCMAKLIGNGDFELTSMDKKNLFITLQVRFRDIQRVKSILDNSKNIDQTYLELVNQLDVLYRQICETLINAGFYELPEKITRG